MCIEEMGMTMKRLLVFLFSVISLSASAAPGPGFFKQSLPVQQGLKGWWRADGPAPVTAGEVTIWIDESPAGGTWQQANAGGSIVSSGFGAQIIATAQNGKPAVRFGATGHTTSAYKIASNPLAGATQAEVIAVVKSDLGSGTDNYPMWRWGSYSVNNSAATGYYPQGSLDEMFDDFASTTRPATSAVGSPARSAGLLDVFTPTTGTKSVYLQGSALLSSASNTVGWDVAAYLGYDPISFHYWQGDFYEILIFNRLLTHAERVAVYAYLNARWSLSSPTAPRRLDPEIAHRWRAHPANDNHAPRRRMAVR